MKKKTYLLLLILCLALGLTACSTGPSTAGLLLAPKYPEMVPYPNEAINTRDEQGKLDQWIKATKAFYNQPAGYADSLIPFFRRIIPEILVQSDKNTVCSPLNIYMALAMLAETAGGDSRQQMLDLLGAESLEASRTQAGHVWNAHYRSDGTVASLLANSLWLNEGCHYNRSTVDTLADRYYASVYQGDLGSVEMNEALRNWLSEQTHGLLDNSIKKITLDPDTALALASTVFFQAKWHPFCGFHPSRNAEGVFHSPTGDIPCTFMNNTLTYGPYYYGEDYSAVFLGLEYSGGMWLILPDEGYDPQDILESGHALDMILTGTNRQSAEILTHICLPKFDIAGETDLLPVLTDLGLGDLFNPMTADFSGIIPGADWVFLNKASHATRVAIDEEGVTAAAYTVMGYYGAGLPPEEEVYFTLDRPFIFVITSEDGLPLFAGVVNQP